MKPSLALRAYLAIAGSSLLVVSNAHAQATYLTTLDVSSPTTIFSAQAHGSYFSSLNGPLTGSSTLTHTGYFNGTISFINNAGNTFNGNIIVDTGTLRIAGNPFLANAGFIAPSMTSSNTITINRAGILLIDDTVGSGYVANRFGTSGNRPAVALNGGTINLTGLNNVSSSVQTFGALTTGAGYSTINVTRSNGNPTLEFASLTRNSGSIVAFTGTALGTGTADARIKFTAAPTTINGIMVGALTTPGALTSNFVKYDATNGVTAFTASDYTDTASNNDITAGGATQNMRMDDNVSTVTTLTGNKTINSLHITGGNGTSGMNFSLGGNTLTLASGMLMRSNINNSAPDIQNGTLTAGTTSSAIDLNVIVAQGTMNISSNIANNAAGGVVSLVKGGSNTLNLTSAADNGYSGGTHVVEGTLSTGTVANRRYLGTGQVTVNNAILALNQVGATSNSSGDDYTAINTGRINLANLAYAASDTFNIGAGSMIAGTTTALNSLDRTSNITLAGNAIIGHSTALTGALNMGTGTIKNLGSAADLYYGLAADQTNAGGAITIGTNNAFKGISGMRSGNTTWSNGTINVASGTSDVYFQSMAALSYQAHDVFALGNGTGTDGIKISMVGTGTLNVNLAGRFNLNETLSGAFGDTTNNKNVRFVVGAGSELGIGVAAGMGSGSGIASALVQSGGFIRFAQGVTATDAFNGAVTVQSGGRFDASLGQLNGTGALTFNEGSILNITNVTGFSGTQATAASLAAGTIVRLNVDGFGLTGGATLDSFLNEDSEIYQVFGGDRGAANPATLGTTVLSLNKSGGGVGGILTNDTFQRTYKASTNGVITVGSNGGVIASTTGFLFTVAEDSVLNGNLELGTTQIVDAAPKLGAVTISGAMDLGGATRTISALGGTGTLQITGVISNGGFTKDGAGTLLVSNAANTYLGTTTINAGTLAVAGGSAIANTGLVSIANVAGATLRLDAAETIGNLSGGGATGGTVNLQGNTLTVGDSTSQTYAGVINGTTGALTKVGSGTLTLSNGNAYAGITTAGGGVLKLNHTNALPGGTALIGGTSNLTINGGGVVGLTAASGDFLRARGNTVAQVQWTGSGGFAAYGADRTVNLGNSGATAQWNTGSFVPGGSNLVLSAADSDATLIWANPINFAGGTRTIQVNNGSAAVDARLTAALGVSGGAAGGLVKTGLGKLQSTADNIYTGTTAVSAGTLELGNNGTTGRLSATTGISVASGATLSINRSDAFSEATGLNGQAISGDGSLVQAGGGTTTLALTHSYTGTTTVSNGTLIVNGNISTSSLTTVQTGATLGGTGIVGDLTIDSGGFFSPGNSPGITIVNGDYTQNGTLIAEITGLTAGTQHDQVQVNGSVTLNGLFNRSFSGFTPVNGNLIFILLNDGIDVISGTFTGLAQGASIGSYLGLTWEISYTGNSSGNTFTGGNDVVLMAVPEPRAALLGGIGVLLLLRRRRS